MKITRQLLSLLLLLQTTCLFSQTSPDTRKYIEVTGSAEKTFSPDEIELEIVIQEYSAGVAVIKLDNIEKDFYAILKKNNIDTQALKLNSLESNYWWYRWSNRNKPLKTKSFKLGINSNVNFLKLTEDLDKRWVESINITDKKNKNIQEYRKEVKILAIKAAKEKATYLLESINEHPGGVLSVEEIPENSGFEFRRANAYSNSISFGNNNNEDVQNVSAIKIRYEIKVKFEIK